MPCRGRYGKLWTPVARLPESHFPDKSSVVFLFTYLYILCLSMPGETVRNCVGRSSGATLGDKEPAKVELVPGKNAKKEEGTCQRWFRKICPCCIRNANRETDGTGIKPIVGPEDHREKLPAEDHETDGKVLNAMQFIPLNTTLCHLFSHTNNTLFHSVSLFSRKSVISACYRPHQVQKRWKPPESSHGALPGWQPHRPQRANVSYVDRALATFQPQNGHATPRAQTWWVLLVNIQSLISKYSCFTDC